MSIELLIPDGLEFEQLAAAVSRSGLVAEDAGSDSARRIYYDTFDGRLRAGGSAAIYENGRLARGGDSAALDRPPERLLAAELEPGPLREALAPLIDARALLPLAELQIRERRLRILDTERKTVVRGSIEQSALPSSNASLRTRVRLTALRGYGPELERVRTALERELRLECPPFGLADEAVAMLGGTPGGVSSKVAVKLEFGQRADAAAVAVLGRLLEVMVANLDGAVDDLDSEFLHDLRVAVRRSRSVQRQLKGVFPSRELERFRAAFRWVQNTTGEPRDLDVYMRDFEDMRALVAEPMRPDLDPLREVLSQRRAAAHERMVVELRSDRFTALCRDWGSLLERLPAMPVEGRPGATVAIGPFAGRRIAKVYRRMLRDGRTIDERGPSEPFHELRKRGKELRYLLELFGAGLYPAGVVKPMIKTLKSLQDVLGRHQDREVQTMTLGSLATELRGDQSALLATGALIARLDDDKRAARSDFAECFASFASKDQSALVEETFA